MIKDLRGLPSFLPAWPIIGSLVLALVLGPRVAESIATNIAFLYLQRTVVPLSLTEELPGTPLVSLLGCRTKMDSVITGYDERSGASYWLAVASRSGTQRAGLIVAEALARAGTIEGCQAFQCLELAAAQGNQLAGLWVGLSYIENGQYARAYDVWQSVGYMPGQFWFGRGRSYRDTGQQANALAAFAEALKFTLSAVQYYEIGIAFREAGEYAEAEQAFSQVIVLRPDLAESYALVGEMRFRIGRSLEECIAPVLKAIYLQPTEASHWELLGQISLGRGDASRALDAYRMAVTIKPNEPGYFVGVGTSLFALGRWDEAIEVYNAALTRGESSSLTYARLGQALGAAGRVPEAKIALRQAQSYTDLSSDLRLVLADAYERIGDYCAALKEYNFVLAERPSDGELIRKVEFLNRLAGEDIHCVR